MKKPLLLSLLVLFGLFISSCKKEPLSCASADKSSALTDETIAFTSCAENASRIVWDFGDGKTEEGNSVNHSYAEAGSYLVQMTAYSKKDKKWDRSALMITITEPPVPPAPTKRYLTKIVLKAVPDKKPNGDDWDGTFGVGTSTSDPYIVLKLDTGAWSKESSMISNISQSQLPATWKFTPETIILTKDTWTVEIWDGASGIDASSEVMNTWSAINLGTYTASSGVISLTAGTSPNNYAVDIYFEEK